MLATTGNLATTGMSEKEGTWRDPGICAHKAPARKQSPCTELEGTGATGGRHEGEERMWALLRDKTSGAGHPGSCHRLAWGEGVALGTKVEKGTGRSLEAQPQRLVGADGGGQLVGVGMGRPLPPGHSG